MVISFVFYSTTCTALTVRAFNPEVLFHTRYKNSLGSIFLQMYKIHYKTFVPRAYFDTYMKFLLQLFKKSLSHFITFTCNSMQSLRSINFLIQFILDISTMTGILLIFVCF